MFNKKWRRLRNEILGKEENTVKRNVRKQAIIVFGLG
jgi:hypothetical protein